jgi:hypothetical protein
MPEPHLLRLAPFLGLKSAADGAGNTMFDTPPPKNAAFLLYFEGKLTKKIRRQAHFAESKYIRSQCIPLHNK